MIDSSGIQGYIFHYSFTFALAGSALLTFVYLWRKGRLDLDEEPKMQVFEED